MFQLCNRLPVCAEVDSRAEGIMLKFISSIIWDRQSQILAWLPVKTVSKTLVALVLGFFWIKVTENQKTQFQLA